MVKISSIFVAFLENRSFKGNKGPFKYYIITFLTFLGPPTSLMIYSTVNHQKLPFSDPTHPPLWWHNTWMVPKWKKKLKININNTFKLKRLNSERKKIYYTIFWLIKVRKPFKRIIPKIRCLLFSGFFCRSWINKVMSSHDIFHHTNSAPSSSTPEVKLM